MPRIDRIPRLDTRTRRAFGGIGMDFVPYTGAIKDVDLGAFNLTTTGVITAANLVLSDKNGIDFTHATDEDIDIIELSGITGDPKMYWDESEDRFRFTKGLFVDVNVGILGTLSVVGLATVGELNVDTLNLSGNVISDSTGTISFDNENLITTGVVGIGTAPNPDAGVTIAKYTNTTFKGLTISQQYYGTAQHYSWGAQIVGYGLGTTIYNRYVYGGDFTGVAFSGSFNNPATARTVFVVGGRFFARDQTGKTYTSTGTGRYEFHAGNFQVPNAQGNWVINNPPIATYNLLIEDKPTGYGSNHTHYAIYSKGGDVRIAGDNDKTFFGTGNDATIYYDGTDLRLDSRKVGTGNVVVSDSLMVNHDSAGGGVVEHLILNGSSGDDPEARGGSIKWNKWGSGVAGYTFANADGRVVWDTTEQASRTDAGNAWIGFDGSSHFGSSTIGDAANYTEIKTDGEINLHGTARVIRHLRVGAASWDKGAAAPTAGFEGVFSTLDFDAVLDDEAHYTIIVPYRWDSTVDVEFAVDWFYDGGQDNGTVCWGLEYKAIKAGEAVTGAGTTITKVSAGTHTTGQMVRTTFTTKILAANLEAGDTIGFRLYRDVSGDTLATDARLINTHFHFTMNKLGEAT